MADSKLIQFAKAVGDDIKALRTAIKNIKSSGGGSGGGANPPSQYYEMESASILRSKCRIVSGDGNSAVYEVKFKKPFSAPPRLLYWCVIGTNVRITAMHHVYNVSSTGFYFTQNYVFGDVTINYTAVVDSLF